MTDVRAADLPRLTVIAGTYTAWIKNAPTGTAQWSGTNGGYFDDWFIDGFLADGAKVLRVGDGTAGEG